MKILSWNILASEWIDETYHSVKKDGILNNKVRFNSIFHYIDGQDATVILLRHYIL